MPKRKSLLVQRKGGPEEAAPAYRTRSVARREEASQRSTRQGGSQASQRNLEEQKQSNGRRTPSQRTSQRAQKRRKLLRIERKDEASQTDRSRGRPVIEEMEVNIRNYEIPIHERAFVAADDSLSQVSDCQSLFEKNAKIMRVEPRKFKARRALPVGDVYGQSQRAAFFRLKPDLCFSIFNYLGALELQALVPAICRKMKSTLLWYKSVAKHLTLEIVDPRLYETRGGSSGHNYKVQVDDDYLSNYYSLLASYPDLRSLTLLKHRHSKLPANFGKVMRALPSPLLLKSLKMDDMYEPEDQEGQQIHLDRTHEMDHPIHGWAPIRPNPNITINNHNYNPNNNNPDTYTQQQSILALFPNLQELQIAPPELLYFGNLANPFSMMMAYLSDLVGRQDKPPEEGGGSEEAPITLNLENSGALSPPNELNFSVSEIEPRQHKLKRFSLILTGSNVSPDVVPGIIKSLFKYLSEQRTLEQFEFRLGGRRNMGMAALDNQMYNYKIGSQLRKLHMEVDFLFDLRKSAEHFIAALNSQKALTHLSVSRTLFDTAPRYFLIMLSAKSSLRQLHLFSTINYEFYDRGTAPAEETVYQLYDLILNKLKNLDALTIPIAPKAEIMQPQDQDKEEPENKPLLWAYLARFFEQGTLTRFNLDLTDNYSDELLREEVLPLVKKYLYSPGKSSVKVFNGIEIYRVLHEGYQVLDLRRILLHLPRNYQWNMLIGRLTLQLLEDIMELQGGRNLKYLRIPDINEKAECHCTLGTSSSYLVNRVNDPALFNTSLFLKIFEDSENIDSFTNYALTSDLLKFKYFSPYLSTSTRVPTRDICLDYVRGDVHPTPAQMLFNFGKRITNGTQHHVKAKLVKEGNIKMTVDRVMSLFSLPELMQECNDHMSAVMKFREQVKENMGCTSSTQQINNERSFTKATRATRSRSCTDQPERRPTTIRMVYELNENYVLLPRRSIISSRVRERRLRSFGFSENGELDKIYIPLLRENPHIQAICLDSDRLNPLKPYMKKAFLGKPGIKRLHFRGTGDATSQQLLASLQEYINSWDSLQTFALVKTNFTNVTWKILQRTLTTRGPMLRQLFIQNCEFDTEYYAGCSFLLNLLGNLPRLEVLGLDVTLSGRLRYERPEEPVQLPALRQFSCRIKNQTDRSVDALETTLEIVRECRNLEIFSAITSNRHSLVLINDDAHLVRLLCQILSQNEDLRCYYLDADIGDDIAFEYADTALSLMEEREGLKFFCSVNCSHVRRYLNYSGSRREELGCALYEHMDISDPSKDFQFRWVIPLLTLIAERTQLQEFPVHKQLRYDFKEMKSQMAQASGGVSGGGLLSYKRKQRYNDKKEPLALFLGVVVPKLQPIVLKLEGISIGLGMLCFAVLKKVAPNLKLLRELSFANSKFEPYCKFPGSLIDDPPRLDTVSFRSTNILRTYLDDLLLSIQNSRSLKTLDLGAIVVLENSQYRKMLVSLGQNKSIKTLTLPCSKMLLSWFQDNQFTQRLIITMREKEFLKEIFTPAPLQYYEAFRSPTRIIHRAVRSLGMQPIMPMEQRQHNQDHFQNDPQQIHFTNEEGAGGGGGLPPRERRGALAGTPEPIEIMDEGDDEEQKGVVGGEEGEEMKSGAGPEGQEPAQEQCRNFLHLVAREGREKQLRSLTLQQEFGNARVLIDLKKLVKHVSHEPEVSSSKEGRNKHLVFKPQAYALRSESPVQVQQEKLTEWLIRCYMAMEDPGWQVSRFGCEKCEFEEFRHIIENFAIPFAQTKPVAQFVLEGCELSNMAFFTFLRELEAEKVNLRNNNFSAEQLSMIARAAADNPRVKQVMLGGGKRRFPEEAVRNAVEGRAFTLTKKHELHFD